jgi:hypothetical protein
MFLDADMELTPCVLESCEKAVQNGADAVCILEQSVGTGYWSRVRELERSRYFRSEIYEAARCFRKSVFNALGGYDPAITGVEDLDIQARLFLRAFRLGWVNSPILHHEENLDLLGYLRKRTYYKQSDGIYASRYPDRWKQQHSVTKRLNRIFPGLRSFGSLQLVPGLAIMRGLEYLLRGQA